jgi:hypothetical protein
MITIRQGMKISAIVDKLQIKINDPNADAGQIGADVFMQLISKAHRAENEIYSFIAEFKGCTADEAQGLPLVDVLKEIAEDTGLQGFFSSALKSQGQD